MIIKYFLVKIKHDTITILSLNAEDAIWLMVDPDKLYEGISKYIQCDTGEVEYEEEEVEEEERGGVGEKDESDKDIAKLEQVSRKRKADKEHHGGGKS